MKNIADYTIEDLLIKKIHIVAVEETNKLIQSFGLNWSDLNNMSIICGTLSFFSAFLVFQEFAFPRRYIQQIALMNSEYLSFCVRNDEQKDEGFLNFKRELGKAMFDSSVEDIETYIIKLDNGISDLGDAKHDNSYTEYFDSYLSRLTNVDDKEKTAHLILGHLNECSKKYWEYNDKEILNNFCKEYIKQTNN